MAPEEGAIPVRQAFPAATPLHSIQERRRVLSLQLEMRRPRRGGCILAMAFRHGVVSVS
jgi:hypothetical protein